MQLSDLYKTTRTRLQAAGIDSAGTEARMIIRQATGLRDTDLIVLPALAADSAQVQAVQDMLARRLAGEPISRIFGCREFWSLPFAVTPAVLDPRPDSETLVQAALDAFRKHPPAMLLDLGTGSGCLAIALLHEWKQCRATVVDISADALAVARQNAMLNSVGDRIVFIQGNWYQNLPEAARFDLVISNPPYIETPTIANLDPEVRNYDPILALDGGIDGFDSYRIILSGLGAHLSTGGLCLLETGYEQHDNLTRLAENHGFSEQKTYLDLNGTIRVVEIASGDK